LNNFFEKRDGGKRKGVAEIRNTIEVEGVEEIRTHP